MPTVVVHAPHSQVQRNQKKSFNQTLATGRAEDYIIYRSQIQHLSPGDAVVVTCKEHKKQAIGRLRVLVPTVKANNGMQRYDIIIDDLKPAAYTQCSTRLGRTGIAVI